MCLSSHVSLPDVRTAMLKLHNVCTSSVPFPLQVAVHWSCLWIFVAAGSVWWRECCCTPFSHSIPALYCPPHWAWSFVCVIRRFSFHKDVLCVCISVNGAVEITLVSHQSRSTCQYDKRSSKHVRFTTEVQKQTQNQKQRHIPNALVAPFNTNKNGTKR
eukprot:m.81069 g.81069  ORF g.81069 m.81069 type:complete len:159 (+) comp12043_c0_seq2:336-812(+)